MAFAIHIRGAVTPGQRIYKHYDPSRKRTVAFYAENGLIYLEDENNGDFKPCGVKEFMFRALALSRERDKEEYPFDKKRYQHLIEGMVACAKTAEQQGDPFNARNMADMAKNRNKNRIFLPGGGVRDTDLPPMPMPPPGKPFVPFDF